MTAPMTVEAVMALAEVLRDVGDGVRITGCGCEPAENQPRAALRAAVELLAQQARDAALDEAAQACRRERVAADETGMPEDRAYNYATEHCESAIHALKTAL